jgi:DNA-binding transcriptional LysR family regulator
MILPIHNVYLCIFSREKKIEKMDDLSRLMKNLAGTPGNIRIGVTPHVSIILFPKMLNVFRNYFPNINIELMSFGSEKTWRMIHDGQFDLAITTLTEERKSMFNYVPIFDTELVFTVGSGHRFANYKLLDYPDLENEPILLQNFSSPHTLLIKQWFDNGEIQPNVLLYSSQFEMIRSFIEIGQAGAFLMNEVVKKSDSLIGIPLKDPIPIHIGLIWKKNTYINGSISKFIKFASHYIPA